MDLQDIVATGGIDTNAVLFDRASGQILCTLTGHSKKVFPHYDIEFCCIFYNFNIVLSP
jgi:hypothetical protein